MIWNRLFVNFFWVFEIWIIELFWLLWFANEYMSERVRRRSGGARRHAQLPGIRLFTWTNQYITYRGTSAEPMSWHTTQDSHLRRLACSRRAASAPGKCARILWGTVPKSPTGTTGSLPKIDSTGTIYNTCFFWVQLVQVLLGNPGSDGF